MAKPALRVHCLSASDTVGILECQGLRVPCALGRSGIAAQKREGDGATPRGVWALREVLYRADRGGRPRCRLPMRAIRASDGWCDDPQDRNYNRRVTLPYPASHEILARTDHLYDLVVTLGYNDGPRSRHRGSAIFLHLARRGFKPTEGCIAVHRCDLLKILARLGAPAAVNIGAKPRRGPYRGRRGFR